MSEDQIVHSIQLWGKMSDIVKLEKNKYRGYRNGAEVIVTIRKNPRLGYWVEVQKNGGMKIGGNHDPSIDVALSIAHWSELD